MDDLLCLFSKIINFFFKESIITLWLCSHQISIWHVSNSTYQYSCLLSNPINGLRTICLASINCQFYIITQLGLPKTIICQISKSLANRLKSSQREEKFKISKSINSINIISLRFTRCNARFLGDLYKKKTWIIIFCYIASFVKSKLQCIAGSTSISNCLTTNTLSKIDEVYKLIVISIKLIGAGSLRRLEINGLSILSSSQSVRWKARLKWLELANHVGLNSRFPKNYEGIRIAYNFSCKFKRWIVH